MKISFLLLFSTIIFVGFSQSNYSEGFIDYKFSHHYDTINSEKKVTETLRLFYNKNMSIYRSLARLEFEITKLDELKKAEASGNLNNINFGKLPSGSIEQFFTNTQNLQTIVYRKFKNVDYLMPDSTPINWTLMNDTSNVLGIKCQKATCYFKGRDYEVWFAKEIPYSIGPWKLKGLPGAILKAIDSKNQVSFEAININLKNNFYNIMLPLNPKYITHKELSNIIKIYRENSDLSTSSDGDMTIRATNGNNMIRKFTKANNPVELTD